MLNQHQWEWQKCGNNLGKFSRLSEVGDTNHDESQAVDNCEQVHHNPIDMKSFQLLFFPSVLRIEAEIGPPGFEPGSWDPEPHMMDRYTRGLSNPAIGRPYFNATAA